MSAKIGRIMLDYATVKHHPKSVAEIFAHFVPRTAKYSAPTRRINYVGWSEQFDELGPLEEPPAYGWDTRTKRFVRMK